MSHSAEYAAFLSHVPADGSPIGNMKLRELLGWNEGYYCGIHDGLLKRGDIVAGRGKGGSVMLNPAHKSAAKSSALEMFAADEVSSPAPPKRATKFPVSKKAAAPASGAAVTNYQYPSASRKNIPPAGLATKNTVQETNPHLLAYDPHLSPVLRFDPTSGTDELFLHVKQILEKARTGTLTQEETQLLEDTLLRSRQPWLEWAGKREKRWFEVDPVALHIHERVRARAILKAALREDLEPTFWDSPKLSREQAMSFYQHDVDWENRLILGDSLQVMTSLARREGLAGKVQMMFIDPPYGIKFSSNWQNEVGKTDVRDSNDDLTREPEMIKAYRDTWTLGVHSYLDYLKQRLIAARELLTDSGSVFVQISDENLHRVRAVMDEVFGAENFCAIIAFVKTSGVSQKFLPDRFDHLIWFARNKDLATYKQPYAPKTAADESAQNYNWCEFETSARRGLTKEEKSQKGSLGDEYRIYKPDNITSQGNPVIPIVHVGRKFAQGWKTNLEGMGRLGKANRLHVAENSLQYVRYITDFPAVPLTKLWTDTQTGSFTDDKVYVVQTGTKTIERCIQMTTEPGDLVLDPTCGSGTTAYVAEQLGRRWITVDSSRVAVAVARQRLLTAKFETFRTKDTSEGVDPTKPKNPATGFIYRSVPHITLKSIAQNKSLDPIFEKHEPILDMALHTLNGTLFDLAPTLQQQLVRKLIAKHQEEGARSVTDAVQRRWLLPGTDPQFIQPLKAGKGQASISLKQAQDYRDAIPEHGSWFEWQVPFDTDPDWPAPLQAALTAYRQSPAGQRNWRTVSTTPRSAMYPMLPATSSAWLPCCGWTASPLPATSI